VHWDLRARPARSAHGSNHKSTERSCWRDFPLADEVAKHYSARVKVDNDANAGGLAEYLWGAGRGIATCSSRRLAQESAPASCLTGKSFTVARALPRKVSRFDRLQWPRLQLREKGCIEVLASGTAIARRTRERLAQSPELGAQIMELAAGDPFAIRSEMIGKAAQSNDPLAKEILEQTLEYLAIWLGNTVDLLEPEVIILGGGAGEMLRPISTKSKSE